MDSTYLRVILGLLLLAGCSIAGHIQCKENQKPVVACSEQTILLPCHFEYSEESKLQFIVTWQAKLNTGLTVVVHTLNDTVVETHSKFQKRAAMSPSWYRTGNATLQITQVKREDSGNYTCYIRADGPARACAQLELTVNSAVTLQHGGHPSAWIMILLLPLAKLVT